VGSGQVALQQGYKLFLLLFLIKHNHKGNQQSEAKLLCKSTIQTQLSTTIQNDILGKTTKPLKH